MANCNSAFDNRKSTLEGIGVHFQFKIEEKSFIYLYIRKNACSAFKNLICDSSEYRLRVAEYQNNMEFMLKYHLANEHHQFLNADHVIFVYRNPIERAISMYLNKFVARYGNQDIFSNYEYMTRCDPLKATFREFVFNYLGKINRRTDPHCHTQFSHLKPILYTDAILMETLYERMSLLIGGLSRKYFKQKINASSLDGENNISTQDYSDVPSDELFAEFQRDHKKMMPHKNAFLDDTISKKLSEIYNDDINMIKQINCNRLIIDRLA